MDRNETIVVVKHRDDNGCTKPGDTQKDTNGGFAEHNRREYHLIQLVIIFVLK